MSAATYKTERAARLSRAEEVALARRSLRGDAAAAERLILGHLPFVERMARRYSRYGMPVNDLVQEGLVGLLQAVRRYDPEGDARFATYATWWVRAAIQGHVVRSWSMVRIGTTSAQRSLFFRLRRLSLDQVKETDERGPVEDALRRLAERFGLDLDEVRGLARRIGRRDSSLDAPVPDPTGSESAIGSWIERIADPRPDPEATVVARREAGFWQATLAGAIAALPPRERLIIHRRHLAEARCSFAAIARELGLSKERVRQLERRALDELRRLIESTVPSPVPAGGPSWAGD